MRPSATELESLERLSMVVPDTWLMKEESELCKPKAASVTPRLLSNLLSSQGSFPVYKVGGSREFTVKFTVVDC